MISSQVHIHFNGNAADALKFYEKTLNGKTTFLTKWEKSPMAKEVPDHWQDKILHATFQTDGLVISCDDAPPGRYFKPQGFEIMLNFKDLNKAEQIFKSLSEKGQVFMPFSQTFWAKRFAMFVDQFGISWMINCPE